MSIRYMKNAPTILLLIGSFPLIVSAPACSTVKMTTAPADPWTVYTYAEQGFSARFPMEPKRIDKGILWSFEVNIAGGSIQYSVTVSPAPGIELPRAQFNAITDALGEKGASRRDIELQGRLGRELVSEVNVDGEPHINILHIYFAKDHMYQVNVSSPKSKQGDAEPTKFLDSFRILDTPKP